MKPLILISYMTIISISAFIYLFNQNKIKQEKQLNKKTYLEWSLKFNFQFIESWLIFTILVLHLIRCIYLITNYPNEIHGHFALMLLILVLSFYPRWKFSIGSEGVLFGTTLLKWSDIISWKFIKNKRKKLNFIWQPKGSEQHTKKKSILVPPRFADKVLEVLKENLQTKEQEE